MSAFGFARGALALGIPELPLSVPPVYLVVAGGTWGLAGLAMGLGLLRGTRWAPAFTRAATFALAAWYWADRLLLARSDYLQRSWPAAAVMSLLAVAAAFWVLGRPAAKTFFGETCA